MTPDMARLRLEALRQQPASPEVLQELADVTVTLKAAAAARRVGSAAMPTAPTIEKAKLIAQALAVGPLVDAGRDLPQLIRERLVPFERGIIGPDLSSDFAAWIAELTAELRDAKATVAELERSVETAKLKAKILEQYRELLDLTM